MTRAVQHQRRAGFTLIELLVVIGILIFLFGLTVAFLPAVYQRDGATRGAQVLQAVLAEARQIARRDKCSTGLRIEPTFNQYSDRLTWVQQPVDLTGGTLSVAQGNSTVVQFNGADLSAVRPGDHLVVNSSGVPRQIVAVNGASALTLYAPLPYPVPQTAEYRIVRQPARMLNRPQVNLPANVAVNLAFCSFDGSKAVIEQPALVSQIMVGSAAAPPCLDILFSPNGSVTGQWAGLDRIILYVQDPKTANHREGSPTLVCIKVRTGLISVHPADGGGKHPYTLCHSCRSSGL